MRRIKKIWLCSLSLFLVACVSGGIAEPVRMSHRNRVERVLRDSIYLHDSVFVARRADTVFYEKLRTVYRDRVSVDTFILCDTLCKERVVTVERVVERYTSLWLLPLALLLFFAWRKGVFRWLWNLLKFFIG